VPLEKPNTICSAVAAGYPLDGKKVLNSLIESKGKVVELTDEEVLQMEQLLAKEEAIFVEPSGALPIAAVEKLANQGFFKKDDVVVCIATGNGLKDPKSAVKMIPDPPTIDPDMKEVDNYLKHKIYNIQSEGIKNKQKILWEKIPSLKSLSSIIKNEFSITLNKEVLENALQSIKAFENKGKTLTKQDLQNIMEDHMDEHSQKEKYLEIIDFETKTSKYNQAQASIKIRYGKKILLGQAKGVGTVDAIITALKRSFKDHDKLHIKLTDYNVEIFTGGVDASVKVVMTAVDKSGNTIRAQASSPDVIVASVNAFEKCYNFLYYKNK
jgi:threonine synthase